MKKSTCSLLAALLATTMFSSLGWSETIPVPDDFYDRAKEVYYLPVIVVPADLGNYIPNPNNPAVDLDGIAITPEMTKQYARVRANTEAHIRVIQEKIRQLLSHPVTNESRGTFKIATWDYTSNWAHAFDPDVEQLTPYIFSAPSTSAWYFQRHWEVDHWVYENGNYDNNWLNELFTHWESEYGISRYNTPFNPILIYVHTSSWPSLAGGDALNYGHNSNGFLRVTYWSIARSSLTLSGNKLLSTWLHEIGHSFGGLMHTYEYGSHHHVGDPLPGEVPNAAYEVNCDSAYPLDDERQYTRNCSDSIMSYNRLNWYTWDVNACLEQDANGYCQYPVLPANLEKIQSDFPGRLIPISKWALGYTSRELDEFSYDPAYDNYDPYSGTDLTDLPYWSGGGGRNLRDHPRVTLSCTGWSDCSNWKRMRRLIGFHSNVFAQRHDDFNDSLPSSKIYKSDNLGAGGWATLDITFPEPVVLSRVRVYSESYEGGSNTSHDLAEIEVYKDLTELFSSADATYSETDVVGDSCTEPAGTWRIRFRAGSTGRLILRGIRLFIVDELGLNEREIFAPVEPTAVTYSGSRYESSPQTLVGTDRIIEDYSTFFNASTMWHGEDMGPDNWTSVDVEFPEPVTLARLRVATGHDGGIHPAQRVQLAYRGSDGAYHVVSGSTTHAHADLTFSPVAAKAWKISFQAGSTGFVVVRGLRFYDQDGHELFPPRRHPLVYTNSGEAYSSTVKNAFGPDNRIDGLSHDYDQQTMWHSKGVGANNWTSMYVEFPSEVTVGGLEVYTGKSRTEHPAQRVQIAAFNPTAGVYETLAGGTTGADSSFFFAAVTARHWNVAFQSANSGYTVVRGVRFYDENGDDVFVPASYPKAHTNDGEGYSSKAENILNTISPSNSATGYNSSTMWHSKKVGANNWVNLVVEFPAPVTLSEMRVYSQHSGSAHRATYAKIAYRNDDGIYMTVAAEPTPSAYKEITFSGQTAKVWRLEFKAGSSGYVVIRGVRFYGLIMP